MGKITDDTKYPLADELEGDELFLLLQDGKLKKAVLQVPEPGPSSPKRYTITENAILTADQMSGSLFVIEASCTVTLPPVSGLSWDEDALIPIFFVNGAFTIYIDPDDNDRIKLDGIPLDDGDKITSPGTAGAFISLFPESADGWATLGRSGVWTDGG